ncbi:MAG: hypothetical protein GTO45_14785 [Candidatus Aminicenantes bacterium]|nr:hypothetical protein [Candidatus Aminicenantes bacterium]NIM80020.1 hypothetical protein [Candidatus Aminicenantes bacterium]NIN19374.1 hypothetical protein [Candidatus Aminicenantes bacterium]NIN43273.1 hypothetical protein [Candidatus Aminicenantes bacterium]NIN86015.1 hypothetical protein [Candidatus Aminicenantes bacterium]
MPDNQNEKPLCFVIMPFAQAYDQIYRIIQKVGNEAGFNTQRADEELKPGIVLEGIRDMMDSAAVVVADISEKNPNVYYEVGLAHAGKEFVVLICREEAQVPFDVQPWRHILYKNLSQLESKLNPVMKHLYEDIQSRGKRPPKSLPEDMELGHMAVKCGMISQSLLEERLEELKSEDCPYNSIIKFLVSTRDIDEAKVETLSQVHHWVSDYFNSVYRSMSETTWIKQLYRHVKFVSWRNRFQGDSSTGKRYIPLLEKEIDVYDEAIFMDHILFQKFKGGTFDAYSTGTILLDEMETDQYRCSITPASHSFYKSSHGGSLGYSIVIKEKCTFPLLVNRTFTYLNGFQSNETADNREAGIGIRDLSIERLTLVVDFNLLPLQVSEINGEIRSAEKPGELKIKQASPKCYYVTTSFPLKGSAVYIKWKWKE